MERLRTGIPVDQIFLVKFEADQKIVVVQHHTSLIIGSIKTYTGSMVRAPTIRGRPTPARKVTSSPSSSSSSNHHMVGGPRTTIPKALKRAEKRANLLAKAADAENKGARALLREGEVSISKSSLRRRKRKARDEIGKDLEQGREGGVKDMMDVVDTLEEELDEEEDAAQKEAGRSTKADGEVILHGGKVTANKRKRLLAMEQARQSAVLSDPAYKASPFEALRTHLRNTMAASSR